MEKYLVRKSTGAWAVLGGCLPTYIPTEHTHIHTHAYVYVHVRVCRLHHDVVLCRGSWKAPILNPLACLKRNSTSQRIVTDSAPALCPREQPRPRADLAQARKALKALGPGQERRKNNFEIQSSHGRRTKPGLAVNSLPIPSSNLAVMIPSLGTGTGGRISDVQQPGVSAAHGRRKEACYRP
jgi:hypothetical protein